MMEITERANKYADGKANEAITTAIAQAYMDGYRDGYKDREEEIPVDLRDKKTEYVDLGLPSGTLWATDYEKDENEDILYLPYGKTSKFKLPTKEQWEELENECRFNSYKGRDNKFERLECVGPNGNTIVFNKTGYYLGSEYKEDNKINAWMVTSDDEKNMIEIAKYANVFNPSFSYQEMYTGYSLSVRQVK